MSTVEDFENAPVGATATSSDGVRAMKTDNGGWCGALSNGLYRNDEGMERRGSTLDSPAPTTAREALDLAWELAHEVREGQVIPEGARYLEVQGSGLREYTTASDFKIRPGCLPLRTLEPLPEPLPDWLDAPAVLAGLDGWGHDEREVFIPTDTHGRWTRADTDWTFHWSELRDVIPLYPKGQDA